MATKSAPKAQLTDAQKLRLKQREARELRASLEQLSNQVLVFLRALDEAMAGPEGATRGKKVAHLSNQLDLVNDSIRYARLGVDFRTDDKAAAVRALKAKAVP